MGVKRGNKVFRLAMKILQNTRTYLAGPMQYQNGRHWREEITPKLWNMGITVFDPYHKPFLNGYEENEQTQEELLSLLKEEKFDEVEEKMRLIRNFDLRCVDLVDFLIFYINPKTPTFGTMEELSTAVKQLKPTFIFVEGGKINTPLWICGMVPMKYIYNDISEILSMLQKIDSGEKKIDNKRWKLLKPEYR